MCRFVCRFVPTFSLDPWLLLIPNVDMWVCATGARHSKSLERRSQRTACLRGEAKIYTFLVKAESGGCQTWICGYVRGALGTARVWSGVVKQQYVCFRAAIIQGVH